MTSISHQRFLCTNFAIFQIAQRWILIYSYVSLRGGFSAVCGQDSREGMWDTGADSQTVGSLLTVIHERQSAAH